jgi:hypothetical protein
MWHVGETTKADPENDDDYAVYHRETGMLQKDMKLMLIQRLDAWFRIAQNLYGTDCIGNDHGSKMHLQKLLEKFRIKG